MTEQLFPRSLLYNIEPIEIETGLVESYSSYLIRVAYEHNVTVGHLINKIVIPKMNNKEFQRILTEIEDKVFINLRKFYVISYELSVRTALIYMLSF